jgi:8-amino-7-oxononanoate synthase
MLFDEFDHPTLETFDIEGRLDVIDEFGMAKSLKPLDRVNKRARMASDPQGDKPQFDDEEMLVFTSNNFLGLAQDDRVQAAAKAAAEEVGTGAGASRVSTGDTVAHRELEREIAKTKHTERALVFSSGYAANIGTITALFPDVIFSDEYNHTSIIEGARMSNADVVVYDHCDADDLAEKMAERKAETGSTDSWLIVTDSVFSMDGDVAPLEGICDAAEEYDAWVMVDEAHATGLYGEDGGGIAEREGVEDRIEIQMGTLSKALASQGGYIVGDANLIEYVKNAARSFIFSTGLNPPAAAAARESLTIARKTDRADKLHENASYLRTHLDEMGYDTWGSTHIVPVILGDPDLAREAGAALEERGVRVNNVPAPAVPWGTSRLRVIPLATHTRDEIDEALDAFEAVGEELDVF